MSLRPKFLTDEEIGIAIDDIEEDASGDETDFVPEEEEQSSESDNRSGDDTDVEDNQVHVNVYPLFLAKDGIVSSPTPFQTGRLRTSKVMTLRPGCLKYIQCKATNSCSFFQV